jgi:hypothetical protein
MYLIILVVFQCPQVVRQLQTPLRFRAVITRQCYEDAEKALTYLNELDASIDYRCEESPFLSASCATISNPNMLSSNETVISAGIRSSKAEKQHYSE